MSSNGHSNEKSTLRPDPCQFCGQPRDIYLHLQFDQDHVLDLAACRACAQAIRSATPDRAKDVYHTTWVMLLMGRALERAEKLHAHDTVSQIRSFADTIPALKRNLLNQAKKSHVLSAPTGASKKLDAADQWLLEHDVKPSSNDTSRSSSRPPARRRGSYIGYPTAGPRKRKRG